MGRPPGGCFIMHTLVFGAESVTGYPEAVQGDNSVSDIPHTPSSDADGGPQTNLDEAAPPGVVEAIELYEAAMLHYTAAAAYTVPVRKTSSTSAARAASLAN